MEPEQLWSIFEKEGLVFHTGVPDSTMKGWLAFINSNPKNMEHVIANNECQAIGVAAGYHLATNLFPVVYMQNAGLGKAVNPLTSLTHKSVYSIPVLLMVGWRGCPGTQDAPQHTKMGEITLKQLDLLDIKHVQLANNIVMARKQIKKAKEYMKKNNAPYAIVIKKGTFSEPKKLSKSSNSNQVTNKTAMSIILDNFNTTTNTIFVSTTGKISRDLYNLRKARHETTKNDFYMVGSMGCAASLALGLAQNTNKLVCIFDGDGSTLMELGNMASIGYYRPLNICHFIFDNNSYESTGGQPSISDSLNLGFIGYACGYRHIPSIHTENELMKVLSKPIYNKFGPSLFILKTSNDSAPKGPRPAMTPEENKKRFMEEMGVER